MKKRRFPLLLVLGVFLILLSVSLVVADQIGMYAGAQHCQKIAAKIEEVLPERTQGVPGMYADSVMPVLSINGTDYAAMLEIPAFGLALPVADKWDNSNLSRCPTRFSGSAYNSTLVVGGADHSGQFGFCDKIEHGVIVRVTDMTGAQFAYKVTKVDRAEHAQSQWLMDDHCDLTLFCHDVNTTEYIAVRCDLAYN